MLKMIFYFQGESVDNFNWGVRRPSLSRLEGDEERGEASLSSAMNSLSDVTPVLPKRDAHVGVGAEESSDDEMGSVISRIFSNQFCQLVFTKFFSFLANFRKKSRGQQWSLILNFDNFVRHVPSEFNGTSEVKYSSI